MAISDIPILSMLRTRMAWHQTRQRVLAENVANADTANYEAKDLAQPKFETQPQIAAIAPAASVTLARTEPSHIAGTGGTASPFRIDNRAKYEVRPIGNAVSLEDEMMKVAANQMDFQAATAVYTHSLSLIKTALGKK